jgi:hypothetical protein
MVARSAASDPLTQGDVIEDCPMVGLNVAVLPLDLNDPATKWWTARVIVLTQACDLAQAKVESVLVARVHDAQTLVETGVLKGAVIRDHMRRHLVFGWYFLPAATDPVALRESLIDLRDVHSVPRAALEELIKAGKRVVSLASPYREHLAQHFAVTYMRVALPEPYATQV